MTQGQGKATGCETFSLLKLMTRLRKTRGKPVSFLWDVSRLVKACYKMFLLYIFDHYFSTKEYNRRVVLFTQKGIPQNARFKLSKRTVNPKWPRHALRSQRSRTQSLCLHPSTSNIPLRAASQALAHRPLCSNSSTPPHPSFLICASFAAATVPCFCTSSCLKSASSRSSSCAFRGTLLCNFAICVFNRSSSASLCAFRARVAGRAKFRSGLSDVGALEDRRFEIEDSRFAICPGSCDSSTVWSCIRSYPSPCISSSSFLRRP